MLSIDKAKWHNNADAPVIFMIDDFCNRWVDLNNNGKIDPGEDWGAARDSDNSSFSYIKREFLDRYPEIKVTFFTPVGKRCNVIEPPLCNCYSGAINDDEGTKAFFRQIHHDKRFEIAYHGVTHGIPGKTIGEFQQEWLTFKTVDEAIDQIEKGKRIYLDTFGEYPKGGKYCGYMHNEFSDESIDKTGFLWWCRDWNRVQHYMPYVECFEPSYFGSNEVIDIPSTIEGNLCSMRKYESKMIRLAQKILKPLLRKRKLRLIIERLRKREVISIQEHIAPSRADKITQIPNIYDDKDSLCFIFEFLKRRNVWFATGTEVAAYFDARERTDLVPHGEESFKIRYSGRFKKPALTLFLKINSVKKRKALRVVAPGGDIFEGYSCGKNEYKINIEVSNGIYTIQR
jgi:hypothetical protein